MPANLSPHRLVPFLVSACLVAVVGLAAYGLTHFVPLPHVSIVFIAAVLVSAALWGFWPAVLAAVLSVAASMYFFYKPLFDFRVEDMQNIADLGVFLIVAALTSRLAASVRAQALEARRQQRNVSRLLAFSERIAGSTSDEELHKVIVEELEPVFGRLPASRSTAAVLEAAAHATPADPDYARALLGHARLAVERARLRREVAEARIRRDGEALREALINSVSHDLRTPLAAILGSATALESFGEQAQAGPRRELVATIREETERLQSYIDNVLDLTRIRAGQITPRLELVELADIVNAALRRKQKTLEGRAVQVALPSDLPMLRLDLFLMEHALANVLDNACKYSPPGSPIELRGLLHNGEVIVEVVDQGSGIAPGEAGRVFEPFYRGGPPGGGAAAGTGLGLAICRAFVEANGGSATVESPGAGRGTIVRLRLPVPPAAPADPDDE